MLLQRTVTPNNAKSFSVSDIFYEPSHLCFFYAGVDTGVFEHFTRHFKTGYREADLVEADRMLNELYLRNEKLPDVIFIDVPFDEEAFTQFHKRLSSNILLRSLPVIYNETLLKGDQLKKLKQLQLVDDIISIDANPIDYLSKIMFLKQSKLYNQFSGGLKNKSLPLKKSTFTLSSFFKRTLDLLIALSAIALLLPVLIIVAIAIKVESRGPVFYTSLRAGKGFKVFKFYKFRSMIKDADKEVDNLMDFNQYTIKDNGPKFFKINNDPRVTQFGKFLRNTSIDEIPQLFNVLLGDMSIVGNRPLPIYEATSLTTDHFVERFAAPAGITGLWQVNKRGKADMSIEERIQLDITYSRNCNLLYDLRIMVKTPVALFQKNDV